MLNFFASKDVVAANPMSDTNAPQTKYDAFVSFRGMEIRDNFLSHLVEAFDRKKIKAFVDDKLERGEEIWPSLVRAIEESYISLIIFSKDYVTSRWCLEELVQILEYRKKYERIVIPVFYGVDPTDVRHQTGSYEKAFVDHENKYNSNKVKMWRVALKESADLCGIASSNFGNDAELIDKIVSLVLMRLSLSKNSVNSKGLIGIDKQIAHVESLLSKRLDDTRVIGIWGMGGIGKTTIAEEIFNKLHSVYDGSCFLRNVREESARGRIIFLKEKLFSTLLAEDVKVNTSNGLPNHVERRVRCMKVLIVLDDVNDLDQLEILVGDGDWFRSGSRVIITTRDKQVLPQEDDSIHEVGALDFDEALELFNLNAFKENHVKMKEYSKLSKVMVSYAKGIPLVLKVLSHLLRGKDKKVWRSQLNKIVKMPPKKVYDALRLSYDDLDRKEKKIFLDLACFFLELKLEVGFIKALLKEDENDDSVAVGLERLKDRALISFSEDGGVFMHDIIQEMAWEIVVHECPEDPGKRSRLWDADDICEVLNNDKGSEAIKSLMIPLSTVRKLKLCPYIFAKMSKLQFLHVPRGYVKSGNNLLPQGLQSLPTELRYLYWHDYPLESLPEKFSAEKLVILDLTNNRLENLWHGVQNLVNLKEVILQCSYHLKELPDFTRATNLDVLDIQGCVHLTNVHPSIFSLEKLQKFNLRLCFSLIGFTSNCSMTSKNTILSASFRRQSKLQMLRLSACRKIKSLPSWINNLTKLAFLDIRNCEKLETLPELPLSLQNLHAGDCLSLKTISFPSNVEQIKENRKRVLFWNCMKLDEHSLLAIGLNAQINMMKFACKHLPAPDHELFVKSDDCCHAEYVYPGSNVPEWFVYKTTKDCIVIDHFAPSSPILAFIFCFVLWELNACALDFNITICDDEGEDKGECVKIEMSTSTIIPLILTTPCNHVCLVYDKRCSHDLISRAKNLTRFKLKVAAEQRFFSSFYEVRGFGVYPINTTAHHDFIQKTE